MRSVLALSITFGYFFVVEKDSLIMFGKKKKKNGFWLKENQG